MLQLLQNLGDGTTTLAAVPAPGPAPGRVLIRTRRSLVSAGTERMLVDFGKAGWLGKARQQPEKVRAVLAKVRAEGAWAAWQAVRSKLSQPIPLGYCQIGAVLDAGGAAEFAPGDRAMSNGPHAEVVSIAHGLCARVPDSVSDEAAAFTPLAAIALEGIRLLDPKPGDHIVVTGLGLIGQLAVRLLRRQGCHVLGLDPAADRRTLAEQQGVATAPPTVDAATAALAWTQGRGAAGVLITASTSSNEVISQAARSCRYRGRVVLVGVVGLELNRADFYRNEVSFQVSCSYGRRNPQAAGSAQENFRDVLAWMADGSLQVDDLITHRFDFSQAAAAYAALSDRRALGILLQYPYATEKETALVKRTVELGAPAGSGPEFGLLGAGNFASRTLLPVLRTVQPPISLTTVVSSQGAPALLAAESCGAARASTDESLLWTDPRIAAIFLTTRHDAHAAQAIAALRAGRHVWVEKPLALAAEDLGAVAKARHASGRTLMVGFNRRFAPLAVRLRQALSERREPHRLTVTVNAGRLDPDHWTLDPRAGGGRIVGEACHFVDLLRYLTSARIAGIHCVRRDTDGQDGGAFELSFEDGSSGLIDYRTDLRATVPKEVLVVTTGTAAAELRNWARLTSRGFGGLSGGNVWSRAPRKGHPEAVAAFRAAVLGGPEPIPFDEIVEVSRWAIAMQAMKAGDSIPAPGAGPALAATTVSQAPQLR
jgi:predicted dehydrogenase/threonine dehydrogenase-like Zn-dependent dehydrogenase